MWRRPSQLLKLPTTATRARIRRPDREGHALDAVHLAQVRAQPLVGPQVGALGQQPDVGFAQHGAEAVGVFQHRGMRAPVHVQLVAQPCRRGRHQRRRTGRMRPDASSTASGSPEAECTTPTSRAPGNSARTHRPSLDLVRAEHRERVAVLGAHQGLDFGFSAAWGWPPVGVGRDPRPLQSTCSACESTVLGAVVYPPRGGAGAAALRG